MHACSATLRRAPPPPPPRPILIFVDRLCCPCSTFTPPLSPALTCRAPRAPALMAKVGRESKLWSPSAGNLSLWGKEAMRGDPDQLRGSLHRLPQASNSSLSRSLPLR